jgi:hypothetical protein
MGLLWQYTQTLHLGSEMLASLGSNEWQVIEIPSRCQLLLRTSSRCVQFRVTVHRCIMLIRDRTASAPHLVVAPMTGTVLPAVVAVVSTATRQDAVVAILTVAVDGHLHAIDQSAQITAVVPSSMVCNVMHVSILGTRHPAVICWQLLCSWINTSSTPFLMMTAAGLGHIGLTGGRSSWGSPNVLLPR